jgi:hypothetical protein
MKVASLLGPCTSYIGIDAKISTSDAEAVLFTNKTKVKLKRMASNLPRFVAEHYAQ